MLEFDDTGNNFNWIAQSSIAAGTAAALAADPDDCAANQFANSIVASGNLGCAAIADADVPDSITIDLAATATALAANGANCAAGEIPLGVDASGAVESCYEPSEADISDLVPEHVRGKEFGVVQAANNLGSVIGPILGGWLYDLFSNQSLMVGNIEFFGAGIAFAFSGLLAIVAAILLLLFVKIPKIDTDLETKLSPQPQSTS